MNCPQCGNEVKVNDKFCPVCGTNLASAKVSPAFPPGTGKKPRLGLIVLAVGGLLAAAALGYFLVASGVIDGLFKSQPSHVIYGILDNEDSWEYEAIYRLDLKDRTSHELYQEVAFFSFVDSSIASLESAFSKDGNLIQFIDYEEGEIVILDALNESAASYKEDDEILLSQIGQTGDFIFLMASDEREKIVMRVLDSEGVEVYSFEDLAPLAEIENSGQVIVLKAGYEEDGYPIAEEFGKIEMASGDYTALVSIDEDYLYDLRISPDGKTMVFQNRDELVWLDVPSGKDKTIFSAKEEESLNFEISPDGSMVAVIDSDDKATLNIIQLQDGSTTKIDRDVRVVGFTDNNAHLIYFTEEGSDLFDLYSAKVDGSGKTRLGRNISSLRMSVDTSPDGKTVAYLDGEGTLSDLMVVGIDGKNPVQLDKGVSSFAFRADGQSIVYVKGEDYDSDRPESELYKIDIDGAHQEVLVKKDDGIIVILWPRALWW